MRDVLGAGTASPEVGGLRRAVAVDPGEAHRRGLDLDLVPEQVDRRLERLRVGPEDRGDVDQRLAVRLNVQRQAGQRDAGHRLPRQARSEDRALPGTRLGNVALQDQAVVGAGMPGLFKRPAEESPSKCRRFSGFDFVIPENEPVASRIRIYLDALRTERHRRLR